MVKLLYVMPIKVKMIYYLKLMISIKTQNQKILVRKSKNKDTIDSLNDFYKGREIALNAFKSGIFSLQALKGTSNLGILTHVAHNPDCKVLDPASLKILSPIQIL